MLNAWVVIFAYCFIIDTSVRIGLSKLKAVYLFFVNSASGTPKDKIDTYTDSSSHSEMVTIYF